MEVCYWEKFFLGCCRKDSINSCHSSTALGIHRTHPGVFSSLQGELSQLKIIYSQLETSHEALVEPRVIFILGLVN
jgi:hypothetical protein